MKRIYLIRHGRAEDYDASRHGGDADRRLTPAGRDELQMIGRRLRRMEVKIDIFLTSPLRRAVETSKILADELNATVEIFSEMEPPMNPSRLLAKVRKREECRIALVGHEPGIGQTVATWIGAPLFATPMKKAGIARLEVPASDTSEGIMLSWFITPDLFQS